MDKNKQERRIGLQEIGMSLDDLVRRGARQGSHAGALTVRPEIDVYPHRPEK